jgi:hypothetical protein
MFTTTANFLRLLSQLEGQPKKESILATTNCPARAIDHVLKNTPRKKMAKSDYFLIVHAIAQTKNYLRKFPEFGKSRNAVRHLPESMLGLEPY